MHGCYGCPQKRVQHLLTFSPIFGRDDSRRFGRVRDALGMTARMPGRILPRVYCHGITRRVLVWLSTCQTLSGPRVREKDPSRVIDFAGTWLDEIKQRDIELEGILDSDFVQPGTPMGTAGCDVDLGGLVGL